MHVKAAARVIWAIALSVSLSLAACDQSAPDKAAVEPRPSVSATPSGDPAPKPEESLAVTSSHRSHGPGGLKAPPPVTVRYFDESIELPAWTYCYENGCADGAPPPDPPDVGSPDQVQVEFPLSGWDFKASFSRTGEDCARVQNVSLEKIGEGQFVLRPAGHADTYDVTLFGRGDGDLFTTFRWTTPTDGPLPKPTARTAIISKGDGGPDSYGIELSLTNLAKTPRHAEARITVVASNGESLTFKAKRARGRCFPEGSLYWDGPDDQGYAASTLGASPFTYKVRLTLDGRRYRATARWPDDEIKGNEPSVRLRFEPALPALS
ncbi:MAG: hypothetical protein QOG54_2723 [Actinomycetota bacterium]|jgi:hypothetical protein|nr:hypothetical protein [Actinomycetota bacterium]